MRFTLLILLGGLLAIGQAAGSDIAGEAWTGNKPTADAVVWIDAPNAPRSDPARKVVLDQRNLTFSPHVLAVRTGTIVDFPNHDRVFHNVFSIHDGKKFDLGLYPVGATKKVKFDKPGLSRIFCNIHPNMGAYVMVVNTPYFAISDRQGKFILRDVPTGTYAYHAWKPSGESITGSVTVGGGKPLEVRWR